MKLFHISDLHLGKRVNDFSMLDDQEYILDRIIEAVDAEAPDGVLIAGDVYDKLTPPAEAVLLFDKFLCSLAERKTETFVISGNHDSPERLSFASQLIDRSGVHISKAYDGNVRPFAMHDAHGEVDIYLLPFVRASSVRAFFPDAGIETQNEAVGVAISAMEVDKNKRNVLVAHHFVAGSHICDSEDINVGGTQGVESSVFDDFDYVALGHIHSPQSVGRETLRYCGTPLKYSYSEISSEKSITVVELGEKGDVRIRTIPLVPFRDMRELKGSYDELTLLDFYKNQNTDDYLYITLTDKEDIPYAARKLSMTYKNIMRLGYERAGVGTVFLPDEIPERESKTPAELFCELYKLQNGSDMTPEQEEIVAGLLGEISDDVTL